MRRTAALLLLAGSLTGTFATTASAGIYCDDVLGIEGSGYGPVCTVTCTMKHDPTVDPNRTPVVDPGRPSCMDEDA